MMDVILLNIVWPIGAVLVWYPVYVLLLDRGGSHPPENFDYFMSWVLSLVLSFAWPAVVCAVVLVGPWFISRTIYRRLSPPRLRAVLEQEARRHG